MLQNLNLTIWQFTYRVVWPTEGWLWWSWTRETSKKRMALACIITKILPSFIKLITLHNTRTHLLTTETTTHSRKLTRLNWTEIERSDWIGRTDGQRMIRKRQNDWGLRSVRSKSRDRESNNRHWTIRCIPQVKKKWTDICEIQ